MDCHHTIFEAESDGNGFWTQKVVNGRTVLEMTTCSGNAVNQWGGGATHPRPATVSQITQSELSYTFNVPATCDYQVDVYGRAYNTQPQADHNNDFWLALPSGSNAAGQTARNNNYHKMYRPNNSAFGWSIPDHGNTFCKRLPAGQHTIYIAARSCFMQIDRIVVWCKDGCAFDSAWASKPAGDYEGDGTVNPGNPCTKPVPANARLKSCDLLALHYDIAPDLDDLHAMAAACTITSCYQLDPCVVIGAHGENQEGAYLGIRRNRAIAVANQAFNSYIDTGGLSNATAAINQTAAKWKATIDRGCDVWVAEGGPSDFTREVLVRMVQLGCTLNELRNNVHVVQHSIWNEQQTNNADLAYVKLNTDYIKIDDGNGGGSTADLNNNANLAAFQAWAADSPCASAWAAAFNGLSPTIKLDFSDTVELLYILNIGTGDINSPTDFCNFFECDETVDPEPNGTYYRFWVDGVLVQDSIRSRYCIPSTLSQGEHTVTGLCCVDVGNGDFVCTDWVCEIDVVPGTGDGEIFMESAD